MRRIQWRRPARLLITALAAIAAAGPAAAVGAADGPPPCATGCVTTFPMAAGSVPFGIIPGSRGSEWFSLNNEIGRIDQEDRLTTYAVPSAGALVGWMTGDPSGAAWFAERGTGNIGRIEPNGTITERPLPAGAGAGPQGIVLGSDGDLWISEQVANAIAQMNPSTGEVVEFAVPTPHAAPLGLTIGADGALWFTERNAAQVGRMTLDGTFTEWALAPGSFPNRIVLGPDGAVWFTELLAGKIGRITTDGTLTEFPVSGGPVGIAIGADGQIYTVLFASDQVARLDLAGNVTGRWNLPGARGPLQIARGRGLELWVTDNTANDVFRVSPYGVGQ